MGESKIIATTTTTPIDGTDSENASLNVVSNAALKRNTTKNYAIIMAGEFLGTFLFLFLAEGGTQTAKTIYARGSPLAAPTLDLLLYVSVCSGFALTVNVWVFYRFTGAFFNPSLTFGCILTGGVPPLKGALMGISQLLGGIAASGVVGALTPGKLDVGTSLAPNVSVVQGLFIEIFLTAQLMIAFFLLAVEKHRATYIAPLGIGLCFFTALLFGAYLTGGSFNPARSLGPAVITGDFSSYHWIYWVGPTIGAAIGAGAYKILLFINYTTLNPGQDDDGLSIIRYEVSRGEKFGGAAPKPADENV